MHGLTLTSRHRWSVVLWLLLVVTLVLVVGVASAEEPSPQPPQLTVLGETEGTALTMVYDPERPHIEFMVHSSYTSPVPAQILAVGVTDADGHELSKGFLKTGDGTLAPGTVTPMAVGLITESIPGPGTYTIQFALYAPGRTEPAQESTVILIIEAPPEEDQATIRILDEELVGDFNRTDVTATLQLHLEVSQTTASNVKVVLNKVEPSDKVVLLGFFDAETRDELPVAGSPHTIQLKLHPRQLSAAGWYTGTVRVTAENAAPVEAPVKLVAREAKLEILDEELVFESTRSSDVPVEVELHLRITGAKAENVEISLRTVRVEEKEVPVDTDYAQAWYVEKEGQKLTQPSELEKDKTWTVVQPLEPWKLPKPGVYKITAVVEAKNSDSKAEKEITLILPAPTLISNPSKLELQRCWPDWSHWEWGGENWRWFMSFLGCGDMQEGFTLRTVEANDVVADATLASTLPRNTAGRPLSSRIQFVKTGATTLPGITIGHEPREIAINLRLPGPGGGEYSGAILVESPDLASPHTVDVTVKVRHLILLPLFTIAIGMLVATAASWLRDRNQKRHTLMERVFKLRDKLDKAEEIPKALHDKVLKALADAIQKIRERDWPAAEAKLNEADKVLKAYTTARDLLSGLDKKISAADPGRVVLDQAKEQLKLGKTASATKLATRAQKLFSEGMVLLKDVGELAQAIKEHPPGPYPCARVMANLNRLLGHIEQHIRQKEFVYESVRSRLKGLRNEFYEHAALCRTQTLLSVVASKDPKEVPDWLEKLGPYDGDIKNLEDWLFAMAEGDKPSSKLSIDTAGRWGTLLTADDLWDKVARASKEVEGWPKVKFELCLTDPDEGDLTAGMPITLEVKKRVDQIRPRSLEQDRYSIEWEISPQEGKATLTLNNPWDTVAEIVFEEPGRHKVLATVVDHTRGATDPEEHPSHVLAKIVNIPQVEIVCTTPEEWRLAEEDIDFKVLPFANQDTSRQRHDYVWIFDGISELPKQEPWTKHTFMGAGQHTLWVYVIDSNTGVIVTAGVLQLRIHPSRKEQEKSEKRRFRRQQWWVRLFSLVIACLGGAIATKAFDATFGSLLEYLVAFLWGAGVEATAQSVTLGPLANRLAQVWTGTPKAK